METIKELLKKIASGDYDASAVEAELISTIEHSPDGIMLFKNAVAAFNKENPKNKVTQGFVLHFLALYDKSLERTTMATGSVDMETEPDDDEDDGDKTKAQFLDKSSADDDEEISPDDVTQIDGGYHSTGRLVWSGRRRG